MLLQGLSELSQEIAVYFPDILLHQNDSKQARKYFHLFESGVETSVLSWPVEGKVPIKSASIDTQGSESSSATCSFGWRSHTFHCIGYLQDCFELRSPLLEISSTDVEERKEKLQFYLGLKILDWKVGWKHIEEFFLHLMRSYLKAVPDFLQNVRIQLWYYRPSSPGVIRGTWERTKVERGIIHNDCLIWQASHNCQWRGVSDTSYLVLICQVEVWHFWVFEYSDWMMKWNRYLDRK